MVTRITVVAMMNERAIIWLAPNPGTEAP